MKKSTSKQAVAVVIKTRFAWTGFWRSQRQNDRIYFNAREGLYPGGNSIRGDGPITSQ